MTETPNRTDKDKTKKESTKIVLSLRDNIIDAVVDSLDEEDSQTPRAPCPSPQSSGPKSTLQLGNLIISSSSGLGGSSLNNGMPHSEAVPLNGSAALLHPFISTPDEKKKKKTKKEPTEQDTSTETPNIGNSTMLQEEENEGVSKENESRPAKENVSEEMTTKEEQNEKGSEGEKEEEAEEEENRTKKSMNTAWETRIADYFVVVGTRAETVAADIKSETVKESYTAVVLDRVPAADYKDTRLPGGLDIFCFPNGVNGTASQKNTVPISSMFTLTAEDGTRLYVTTLRIYENVIPRDGTEEESGKKLGKDKENDGIREWYMPVCLCVISHRPFFSLYKSFLSSVHTKICELDEGKPSDFEGFITNFMFKTPVPIPGVLSLDCGKEKKLKLPYPEDFPFIDFSLKTIFDVLGVDNVITLFISILEENKIVFVSRQYSLLFVATQSLITLLYPFCWHHIYVPVMGTKLKDFVHAPTPFIMGVPKECYDSFKQDLEAVEDVTLVDLDYGRVKRPRGKLVYPKGRDKLVESLRTFLLPQIIDVDADLPEAKETTHINRGIQARFLQFFVELFHDYRKYIAFVRKYPYPITTFDKTSFLTQKPHQDKKFLSVFLDTQTFQVFSEVSPLQHPSIFEYASKKYNERKGKFDAATLVDSPKLRVDETGLQEYKVPLQLQCQPGVRRKAITKPLYKLPEIVTPQPNEPEQKQEGRHAKIRCYPKEEELSVEIGDLRPYSKELWTNNEVDWISAFVDAIFEQNDIAWAVPIFHNVLLMEDGPLVFCTILADYISRNDISILTKTVFDTLSTVLYVYNLLRTISPLYHRVNGFPEFIVSTLKTLEMWEDIDFWLYCFFCDNAQRREKLAPNFRSSADDWATMNTKERDDVCLKDETSLYNVIGEICYSVALVGISDAMFKNFIERCAITIRMNETQTGTLMTFAVNIVNSNRASLEQANVEKRSVEGAAEKLFKISKRRGMQPMTHKVLDINMNNSYERLRLGTKKMSKVQRDGFSVTVYELDVGEVIRLIVRDNIVVGGTTSGVVTVWDYKSKRPFLFDFNTHTDGVSALDMDSATSTILVGTRDCKAFAYDLKRRAIIEIFDGHKAQIPSVHIHKRFFLSGSDDKALGIWNRESKGPFHLLQGHAGAILCITTVDAPRRLMLGLDDKEDNDPTKEDKGSNEPQGTPITVNEPTTTFAVTGSEDGSIRVWDLDKLECVIVLKGHCDWVTQVIVVSPTVILSKSADRTVKLWDLERKECVQTYGDEDIIITAFAYNAGEIFAGCEDGTIIRWKLRNPLKPALKFKVVASTVTHISSNIDNSIIITACQDGNMYLWNDSGNVITTLRGHTDTITEFVYTERNEIISGSKDSTIRVWKVEESLLKLGTPKQSTTQAKETGISKEQEQTQQNQNKEQTQPQKSKTIVTTTTTTTTSPPPQSTKKHLFGKDFFRTKK